MHSGSTEIAVSWSWRPRASLILRSTSRFAARSRSTIRFLQEELMSVDKSVAGVDGEWIAQRAAEMVQIPSVTMDEREVCDYYRDALRGLGLDVVDREVTKG